ncbi:ABC transporter related protein [Desulfarculus baarsii DSM 2075]|uniref:ABC transporter related protein n=1 Tax=Desulfarculus baarsii (strain ATCC 33931 / DSM 2075 / LMG 7858 / VKM B-1802 / 2st14) TaxID=644282 RepID=E1QGI1_DESB2|nr:ABC transporter ATP-binding protein [Desulfarculus baarsii]ADK84674.1 ABC transporter related protein [Desulfarculus baarsii DSM 2075]
MPLLSITGLSKNFGGLTALSGLDMSLEDGEMVGLIGPNGAGKTTVFNLVSGFYQPSAGRIVLDGRPTSGLRPHQIAALGVARTFQNIRLWYEMSVLDNIRVAQHYRMGYGLLDVFRRTARYRRSERRIDAIAHELLEAMDLSQYAHERPKNLPYGLQRLVEIARAMSMRPRLLLLDEPAAGLSSADVDHLIDLVRRIHDEFHVTIWMIEHQMKVVMSLCSRIKVIDLGSSIAEGSPERIQCDPAVIKAYLGDETL